MNWCATVGWTAGALLSSGASFAQTTCYVAPCGNDAWTGTSPVCAAPNGPKRTVQSAINVAAPGDTVLLADGTYTGPGNKGLDFGGKDITVRSAAGDPARCVIDCQGSGRAFWFHSGETDRARVQGLGIRGGTADRGGAILCENSGPAIEGCLFEGNTAFLGVPFPNGISGGGAIFCAGSSPRVTRCTFQANRAWDGGAMYNYGDGAPTIEECEFVGNTAAGHIDSAGGALVNWVNRPLVCSDSRFIGNSAVLGGATAEADSTREAVYLRCTFEHNSAEDVGGAALLVGHADGQFVLCGFVRNRAGAGAGGGIFAETGDHTLVGCRFEGNTANPAGGFSYEGGGGLYVGEGVLSIAGCSFTGNVALRGGGAAITAFLPGHSTQVAVVNCTFAANAGTEWGGALAINGNTSIDVRNCSLRANASPQGPQLALGLNSPHAFPTVAVGRSDVEGGRAGVVVRPGSTLNWGPGNIEAHPLFAYVRYPHPGPDGLWGTGDDDYGDLRPVALSAYLDAADNTAVPPDTFDLDDDGNTTEALPIDLAGGPRFVDDPIAPDTGVPGNGYARIVDMGAYERLCYPDCEPDGSLDIFDFLCFQNLYAALDPYACDCDTSTGPGACDIFDFLCFQNAYAAGCP